MRKLFIISKRLLPSYSTLFRITPNYLRFFLHISPIFRTFSPLNNYLWTTFLLRQAASKPSLLIIHIYFLNKTIMQQNQCLTKGRTQLAQMYFPFIQPKSAWEKLRLLLQEDPDLAFLATLRCRTFLPAEVNIIYQHLGQPWAALFRPFSRLWLSLDQTRTLLSWNSDFIGSKLRLYFKFILIANKRVQQCKTNSNLSAYIFSHLVN